MAQMQANGNVKQAWWARPIGKATTTIDKTFSDAQKKSDDAKFSLLSGKVELAKHRYLAKDILMWDAEKTVNAIKNNRDLPVDRQAIKDLKEKMRIFNNEKNRSEVTC